MVEITVPPTYKRGQSLKLKLSDGRSVSVAVPPDVEAGGSFTWTVPEAAPAKVGGLPALKKALSFSTKKSNDEALEQKKNFWASRRPSFSTKGVAAQRAELEGANQELKEAQEVVGDTTKTFFHAQAKAELAAVKQKELEQEASAAESAAAQAQAETNAALVIQKQMNERRKSQLSADEEKAALAQMDEARTKAATSIQTAGKKRAAATQAADEAAAKQAKSDEALRSAHDAKRAADEALQAANDITQTVRKADTKRWLVANRMRLVVACMLLTALVALAVWHATSGEAAKEVADFFSGIGDEISKMLEPKQPAVIEVLKPHQKIAKWVVRNVKGLKIKGIKLKSS